MDKGSVISLDFLFLEEGKEVNIQAKAIVRWTQRFRKPKGMGVEFYDFTGLAGVDFEKYLEKLLQQNWELSLYFTGYLSFFYAVVCNPFIIF